MGRSRTIAAIGSTGVLCAALALTPPVFSLDDAYIALHSARVLVDGHDPVYGVSALIGSTSPAYVALLAGLLQLGLPDLLALRLAVMGGCAAFILAVWSLTGVVGLSRLWRSVVVFISVVSGYSWLHLGNGLETGWAMALLVFLIAGVLDRRVYWAALLAGLLPWLRPDLVPTAVALLGVALWQATSLRTRLAMGSVAALVSVPFVVWLWRETGSLIPTTMAAKQLFYAEHCASWGLKSQLIGTGLGVWFVAAWPLSIGFLGLLRHTVGRIGLTMIAATVVPYLVTFPTSFMHSHQRYLYPILLPWAVVGASWLLQQWRASLTPARAGLVLAMTGGLWFAHPSDRRAIATELQETAAWVEREVPSDAVVLVHDAGAISVFAHRRLVDLVGLKAPRSVELHAQHTAPVCAATRGHVVAMLARETGARYLVTLGVWDHTYRFTDGLRADGFTVSRTRQSPRGANGYHVYRIADTRTGND